MRGRVQECRRLLVGAVLLGTVLFAIVSYRLCGGIVKGETESYSVGLSSSPVFQEHSFSSRQLLDRWGRNLIRATTDWRQIGRHFEGKKKQNQLSGKILLSSDGKRLAVWDTPVISEAYNTRCIIYEWNESSTTWEEVFTLEVGASPLSMSGDGSRIIVGDSGSDVPSPTNFGYLTIYDWNGKSYEETTTIKGTYAGQQLGSAVQLSEDGRRFMTAMNDEDGGAKVEVYDLTGDAWVLSSTIDVISRNIFMSRNGKRVAVSTQKDARTPFFRYEQPEMRIYGENGSSSWSQLGDTLEETFLAVSASGNHIVTVTRRYSYDDKYDIHTYHLVGTSWEKTGQIAVNGIDGRVCYSLVASMSNDGQRVVLGLSGGSYTAGEIRVYDFDGSIWKRKGQRFSCGFSGDDLAGGIEVSISGEGDRVAVGEPFNAPMRLYGNEFTNHGRAAVFQFQGKKPTEPLFQEVTFGEHIVGEIRHEIGGKVLLSSDGKRLAVWSYRVFFRSATHFTRCTIHEWNESTTTWEAVFTVAAGESSLSMSGDGSRIIVGDFIFPSRRLPPSDFGYLTIYDWNGTNYEGTTTINGTYAGQKMGSEVQLSEDGRRFMTALYDEDGGAKVDIYDLTGDVWVLSATIDDIFPPRNILMSRDGKRVAVYTGGQSSKQREVQIFEDNGHSSWSQIGQTLKGAILAMSASGDHIVTGKHTLLNTARYPSDALFRTYHLVGTSWEQTGEFSFLGFDVSASMSSDGRRLVIGSSGGGEGYGLIFVYDFDGSSWNQAGENLSSGEVGDDFGYDVSVSGEGDRVAVGAPYYQATIPYGHNHGRVTVFQFQSTTPTRPLPDNFQEITCAYTSCLDDLLSTYSKLTKFGNGQVAYDTSRSNVVRSLSLLETGKLTASLRKLSSAAKQIGTLSDTAPGFSNSIGRAASACAIELVENFIRVSKNQGILDNAFLDNVISSRLAAAKTESAARKWEKSVAKCNTAVWKIMKELDENIVPLCDK